MIMTEQFQLSNRHWHSQKRGKTYSKEVPSLCVKRYTHVAINLPLTISTMSNLELSECCCLHSVWRPLTHHTWSELESVDVLTKYIMLALGWKGHFHIVNAFFVPTDMITWHGLMFVFPNCTINRPVNHARVITLLIQSPCMLQTLSVLSSR